MARRLFQNYIRITTNKDKAMDEEIKAQGSIMDRGEKKAK